MKLNNKGMMVYAMMLLIAIMFGASDSNSIIIFMLTKVVSFLLIFILFKLIKYVPDKYL